MMCWVYHCLVWILCPGNDQQLLVVEKVTVTSMLTQVDKWPLTAAWMY